MSIPLSELSKKRITIGILVFSLDPDFQSAFLTRLSPLVEVCDINLICFNMALSSESDKSLNLHILNLITPQLVDGLIIMTGALLDALEATDLEGLLTRLSGFPIVSISHQLEGIPSVLTDNISGIQEVLAHLVDFHSVQEFAFVGGPTYNEDAKERLHTFKSFMTSRGIDVKPELIRNEDFTALRGFKATQELLQTGLPFRALVAANDEMAKGAVDAIRSVGLRVPQDILVTGYDDTEEGQSFLPTLTSVSQNQARIIYTALEQLLSLIKERQVPLLTRVSTSLIKRESCGCFHDDQEDMLYEAVDDGTSFLTDGVLVSELQHFKDRGTMDESSFLLQWGLIVNDYIAKGTSTSTLKSRLQRVYDLSKSSFPDSPSFEALFQKANILLLKKETYTRYMKQRISSDLITLQEKVYVAETDRDILRLNRTFLKDHGVDQVFIIKFDPQVASVYESAFLISEIEDSLATPASIESILLSIFKDSDSRSSWIIEPLTQRNPLGLLVMNLGFRDPRTYGTINRMLSGVFYNRTLMTQVKDQESLLERSILQLEQSIGSIIKTLAMTVEAKDPYTAGHERRVMKLAVAIGEELGLDKDRLEVISYAAIIHDFGKLYVPSEILNKPGKLRPEEFSLIRLHPEIAFTILKDIKFPWPLAEIVYNHHERLDGTGYPRNLQSDFISLETRIITVADMVEAIISHRPYRAALHPQVAFDELKKFRGVWYDTAVVDACLLVFEKGFTFNDVK